MSSTLFKFTNEVRFKSDLHRQDCNALLQSISDECRSDVEYLSLVYLVAASGKTRHLLKYFTKDGVDVDELYEEIGPYSNAEKALIRFGFQLFNNSIDDIALPDVMYSLDGANLEVVVNAIKFRYNISGHFLR